MTSTLGFAILAVLARGERTGYDLAAAMRRPVGYFWTAGHSQIHAELQKLRAGGLVGFEAEHGPGPQGRKVYHLTAEGGAVLREWVTEPPRERPERDELVLKTYASWLAEPELVRRMFADQLAAHEERLAEYERQEASFGGPPAFGDPGFGSYATLRCGLSYERHRADWCRWMLAQLSESL
ncbi:PadR family transcriptional regulator [Nonomuraea angiospora]|uniref:DNA-binding PadR family transcriptional regulator n=1 Tax=Nonomuraea angiospora TaxID=46172 RepID=A0ABR9M5B9_9ACTN|nr:helix-turn-helix transcriptional regulator [Nonomuraea angiospora]MBE1588099.1 DNA-binding PadR family transcriptional regulator [Nonomuraea angiospora]